jgi:deoxyadenosine/deoxycytidine kinase
MPLIDAEFRIFQELFSSASSTKNTEESKESVVFFKVKLEEALARQYELNYLEARRKYGKATAEKLFPRIQSRNTSVEPDETATDGIIQV